MHNLAQLPLRAFAGCRVYGAYATMEKHYCFVPTGCFTSTFLGAGAIQTHNAHHVKRWATLRMDGRKSSRPARRSVGKGFGIPQLRRFSFTGPLRPGHVTPGGDVPEGIARPNYANSGIPSERAPRVPWDIEVKDADTIKRMRVAGRLAREVLDAAGRAVCVGATTDDIDRVVHAETISRGAYPSPLNYNRFPKSCCTSINEVVCHGIPDDTTLADGDIINVDVTIFYDGVHGDCSEMFLVGNVDDQGKRLVRTTYDCLQAAIDICGPEVPFKNIGTPIERVASEAGFSVVRNFCGHGIGEIFHTTPNVLHCDNNEPAGIMRPGITFTIEPMINEGTHKNVTWPDDWTCTTLDGMRSSQFEHTLLVTENGVEALTGKIESSPKFFWEEQ